MLLVNQHYHFFQLCAPHPVNGGNSVYRERATLRWSRSTIDQRKAAHFLSLSVEENIYNSM